MFASTLGQEASFLVISVASDFRYHLWAIIACALGLVLARPWRGDRRIVVATAVVLGLILVVGTATRATLPVPPQSYQGMLG